MNCGRRNLCGFWLGLAWLAVPAAAQQPSLGVLSNFTWPDYHPPPHQTQLRFLLKGSQAVPQSGGLIVVRQVTLEKFLETGVREMLIETPVCVFNSVTREAGSAGALKMQFEDGRLTLEGEGFGWQQTNSLLVVSNRVRTTLRGGWLASQSGDPAAASPPTLGDTEIVADRFSYDGKAALAQYRGHVRIAGTNLTLTSGGLTFKLPAAGAGKVENLTAEEDVTIEFGELRATGEKAVYVPGEGLMRLTGRAAWQTEGREGRGRELLLQNTTRTLQVNGEASLKLPVTGAGFIPQQAGAAQTAGAADRFVTITAERYEVQTNRASFTGGVRASERAGEQPRASLACESLSVTFGASNQLQSLVAEQSVVIEDGARHLTGGRATYYDGASGVLQLTGQPTWQDGERSGRGQVLLADLQRSQLTVRGDASLVLPRAQTGTLLSALVVQPGQKPDHRAAENTAAGSSPTRIVCDEYEFSPEAVVFRGQVRVDDAQMQLTSDTLNVKLSPGGTNVASLIADRNVVMSLVETNGQTTTATCARVVYTATNDVLELTGQPTVRRSEGSSFVADVILLNRATGTVSALGKIRGRLRPPTSGRTNTPALPFDKKR